VKVKCSRRERLAEGAPDLFGRSAARVLLAKVESAAPAGNCSCYHQRVKHFLDLSGMLPPGTDHAPW
jgi:hypothetical protein